MLDPRSKASIRKILFFAVLLVLGAMGVALGGPRLVAWFRPRAAPAKVGFDPPARDEERAAARDAERKLARAERSWEKSTVLVPREGTVDANGEKTRWFQGFGLSVESTPRGARVVVNGEAKGETPLVTSVDCAPGDEVEIEVSLADHRPRRQLTTCRKDQLVELVLDLR
jgi:hypothetical protein